MTWVGLSLTPGSSQLRSPEKAHSFSVIALGLALMVKPCRAGTV